MDRNDEFQKRSYAHYQFLQSKLHQNKFLEMCYHSSILPVEQALCLYIFHLIEFQLNN